MRLKVNSTASATKLTDGRTELEKAKKQYNDGQFKLKQLSLGWSPKGKLMTLPGSRPPTPTTPPLQARIARPAQSWSRPSKMAKTKLADAEATSSLMVGTSWRLAKSSRQ
ncbi:MAG: hypothetical protein V9G13_11220 [Marmoricola sp.]